MPTDSDGTLKNQCNARKLHIFVTLLYALPENNSEAQRSKLLLSMEKPSAFVWRGDELQVNVWLLLHLILMRRQQPTN